MKTTANLRHRHVLFFRIDLFSIYIHFQGIIFTIGLVAVLANENGGGAVVPALPVSLMLSIGLYLLTRWLLMPFMRDMACVQLGL